MRRGTLLESVGRLRRLRWLKHHLWCQYLPCLGKYWYLPRYLTIYLFTFKGKSKHYSLAHFVACDLSEMIPDSIIESCFQSLPSVSLIPSLIFSLTFWARWFRIPSFFARLSRFCGRWADRLAVQCFRYRRQSEATDPFAKQCCRFYDGARCFRICIEQEATRSKSNFVLTWWLVWPSHNVKMMWLWLLHHV